MKGAIARKRATTGNSCGSSSDGSSSTNNNNNNHHPSPLQQQRHQQQHQQDGEKISPIPSYHHDTYGEDTMIHRGGNGHGGRIHRNDSLTEDGSSCTTGSCCSQQQDDDNNSIALLLTSLLSSLASPSSGMTTTTNTPRNDLSEHDDDDFDDDVDNKRPRGNFSAYSTMIFWRQCQQRRRQRRQTTSTATTTATTSTTKKKSSMNSFGWYGIILVAIVLSILFIEKIVFSVRYVTMGRPAFLYGSPMEWDDVKGCLSRNWKQEVLNYKINSKATTESIPHKFKLNPNIVWTWYRYSQADTRKDTVITNAKRRLLIAQYSGFGSYSKILKEVSPINRAYAKKWGHDYVTLEGTALQFPGLVYKNDDNHDDEVPSCPNIDNGYEAQSTFNKIPLLFQALEHASSSSLSVQDSDQVYDQVLILDTDTMIVDLDYDITTLLMRDVQQQHLPSDPPNDIILSKEYVMVAYRVWWNDWHWTWDINAGITLWNLNHPTTRQVADTWLEKSMSHPQAVLLKNDDQFFLQRALLSVGWWKRMWDGIRTVREEMEYYDATLIKHFKRDARSWSRTSLDQRLLRIQEAKAMVCQRWPLDCQHVDDDES